MDEYEAVLQQKYLTIGTIEQEAITKDVITIIDELQVLDFQGLCTQVEAIQINSLKFKAHQEEGERRKQELRKKCTETNEEIHVKLENYRGLYMQLITNVTTLQSEINEMETSLVIKDYSDHKFTTLLERISLVKKKLVEHQQNFEIIFKQDLTFSKYIVVDQIQILFQQLQQLQTWYINLQEKLVGLVKLDDERQTLKQRIENYHRIDQNNVVPILEQVSQIQMKQKDAEKIKHSFELFCQTLHRELSQSMNECLS